MGKDEKPTRRRQVSFNLNDNEQTQKPAFEELKELKAAARDNHDRGPGLPRPSKVQKLQDTLNSSHDALDMKRS